MKQLLRPLLSSPTFAVVAILTLALGIGASTAIFSVVNAVGGSGPTDGGRSSGGACAL